MYQLIGSSHSGYISVIQNRSFLTLCMLGNFSHLFFSPADFFSKLTFKNIFQEHYTLSECQALWIQIRPDVLSGLIWVHTVCKDNPQATKVTVGRQKLIFVCFDFLRPINNISVI